MLPFFHGCLLAFQQTDRIRYFPDALSLLFLTATLPVWFALGSLGYELKLWMVNEKREAVFGNGLADLLEVIDKYHSMLKAAEELKMSYRYALHRITLAEKRLGQPLVTRVHGGARGGGSSEVTDFGQDLVERYRHAQAELSKVLEKLP